MRLRSGQGAGNRNHYICDPTQPACIHAGCVGSLWVCRLAKARPTPMLCYYGRDMYRKMFDRYLGPNSPSLNRNLMDDTSIKRSIKKTFFVLHPILMKLGEVVVSMYTTTSPSFIKFG